MSRVSKWLRGSASVSTSGSYVVVRVEGKYGLYRGEVYVTRREATALRDHLDSILRAAGSVSEREGNDG